MNRTSELYWSQHKVFFLATLALFPDKLNGHEVNQWFYSPYFAGDEKFIAIELEDYRKAGYLKYEKPAALFKITSINSKKASDDLLEYLKKWQRNDLLVLSASKPPDPSHQNELLQNAIVEVSANHQHQPRITLKDIYGEPSSFNFDPPFWELVLSYALFTNKVNIKAIGYDQKANGLYDDSAMPFIEYELSDKELQRLVKQQSAVLASVNLMTAGQSINAQRVWLTMPDKHIFAEVGDGTKYSITKQTKGLRTDLAPYSLMKHLIRHPSETVTLKFAVERLDGCERVDNLSEIVRQCGFNEAKKNMFFDISTATSVKLKEDIRLSPEEMAVLTK